MLPEGPVWRVQRNPPSRDEALRRGRDAELLALCTVLADPKPGKPGRLLLAFARICRAPFVDLLLTTACQGYHWFHNAESYWHIGQAMGSGMVKAMMQA